jgi:hypothetical protein
MIKKMKEQNTEVAMDQLNQEQKRYLNMMYKIDSLQAQFKTLSIDRGAFL